MTENTTNLPQNKHPYQQRDYVWILITNWNAVNPFATRHTHMHQLFHGLQWYAGSERVKFDSRVKKFEAIQDASESLYSDIIAALNQHL